MGSFNFKSAGKLSTDVQATSTTSSPTIYGIKTPLRPGTKYVFETTATLAEQIADNFRNLLMTNHGERLGLYTYGANLRPLLSEYVSLNSFDSDAVGRISSAVSLWMPYITLNNFVSSVDVVNTSGHIKAIKLAITYDVVPLNIKEALIEVVLYVP